MGTFSGAIMPSIESRLVERNLLVAGIRLMLGIPNRDKIIRVLTEWLLEKSPFRKRPYPGKNET
jgi:hypothetical protein